MKFWVKQCTWLGFLLVLCLSWGCWGTAAVVINELRDDGEDGVINPVTPPTAFTLQDPPDGSSDLFSLTPYLTWTDANGEIAYQVEINDSNDFTGTVLFSSPELLANTTSYIVPSGVLTTATTYHWRIVAKNAGGNTVSAPGSQSFLPRELPWAKAFRGNPATRDFGIGVGLTTDGGLIFCGESDNSISPAQKAAWVIRFNSDSSIQWERIVGGPNWNHLNDISQTPDGGFIATGWNDVISPLKYRVVKMTSDGNVSWEKTYPLFSGNNDFYSTAVQVTSDGNYAIIGFGVQLKKLASDGSPIWQKQYNGPGTDNGFDFAQTPDAGFIIGGATDSPTAGGFDFLVIKVQSNGTMEWSKTYGGTGEDIGYSIRCTSDGGYVIAGTTTSFTAGDVDILVLKLNSAGDIVWQNRYGGASDEPPVVSPAIGFPRIRETPGGDYIVGGTSDSFGSGVEFWLVKLQASDGAILWQKRMGGGSDEYLNDFEIQPDGRIVLVGNETSYTPGEHIWVVRAESDGTAGPYGIDTVSSATVTTIPGWIDASFTETDQGFGFNNETTNQATNAIVIQLYP